MPIFLKVNHQLESRIQEIWQSGSEGGGASALPTPIGEARPRIATIVSQVENMVWDTAVRLLGSEGWIMRLMTGICEEKRV